MGLTLSESPGFAEVASNAFDAGQPATSAAMKALNSNAAFGAVRNEQFWGYYRHGEVVNLPVSPADGYAYSREELVYSWSWYWTGSAPGPLQGTQAAPTRGATSGAGLMLQAYAQIDQATGLVATEVGYYKEGGAQTNTNDGILLVIVHAQRNR